VIDGGGLRTLITSRYSHLKRGLSCCWAERLVTTTIPASVT
jgi:hypothetical protein